MALLPPTVRVHAAAVIVALLVSLIVSLIVSLTPHPRGSVQVRFVVRGHQHRVHVHLGVLHKRGHLQAPKGAGEANLSHTRMHTRAERREVTHRQRPPKWSEAALAMEDADAGGSGSEMGAKGHGATRCRLARLHLRMGRGRARGGPR